MSQCNSCRSVCRRAKKGDYTFLATQLEQCEVCVFSKSVSRKQSEAYEAVRLNYVIAYWEQRQSL